MTRRSYWTTEQLIDLGLTHEGTESISLTPEQKLRRSVLSCLLHEDTFYESGQEISKRIEELVPQVEPIKVAYLAIEAREKFKLRRVPLLLVASMLKSPLHKPLVASTLERVIQRADQLGDFLNLYGKKPLAGQVKKGLRKAFNKFDEYQLSKWKKEGTGFSLRDVMFLVHPKPMNAAQEAIWKKLADKTIEPPLTWETELSAGKDKKETFEKLIRERRLGSIALLRNLRGMSTAGVDTALVREALSHMKVERVLPYRFISAQRYARHFTAELESAMFKCLAGSEKMPGRTVLLVDVSGSMDAQLGRSGDLMRLDAAVGLAILLREICEDVEVYTFSSKTVKVMNKRGFALGDAIINSQSHSSTYLGEAVTHINKLKHDRLIVITDEQTHDKVPDPKSRAYLINVAPYRNGIGYGKWIHLDGFSESVVHWILEYEKGLKSEFKLADFISSLKIADISFLD